MHGVCFCLQLIEMSLILEILDWLYGTGIAIFPVIGFVFQYLLIRRRQSIGSFSIKVCGTLLLSNILKISFFIYRSFSEALLFQALLMILVQLLLLQLCVKIIQNQGIFESQKQKAESDQQRSWMWVKSFWKWQNLSNYILTIVLVALASFSLAYFISQFQLEVVGQGIGYLAMAFDTCLLVPQLLENIKQNRVKGVSYLFVFLNTAQDMFELSFVIVKDQPIQYVLVNCIQLLADFALTFQIIYYKCLKKPGSNDELNEVVEPESASNTEQQDKAKDTFFSANKIDQQVIAEQGESTNQEQPGNDSEFNLQEMDVTGGIDAVGRTGQAQLSAKHKTDTEKISAVNSEGEYKLQSELMSGNQVQ